MKGYTVFNVEQIDGLPAHNTARAAAPIAALPRLVSVITQFDGPMIEFGDGL